MSPRRPAVVIVGGGITGLTTALRLAKETGRFDVTLLEERPRLGGNIQTERRDGFVIDGGPDSFVTARPQATELCKELGLESRLIGTTERNRKVYVERKRALHPLPEGLVLAVPTRIAPFASTPVFSLPAKVRMALDLVLPRRKSEDDESIGQFIRRRLGKEALERLAEPLMGGIYAGDVETLSMRATFPQLVDLEQRHGSLIRGALAQKRAASSREASNGHAAGLPKSTFFSLLGGMGELIDVLAKTVAENGGFIRTGTRVESVRPTQDAAKGRFEVRTSATEGSSETFYADHLVVATPAHVAAEALEPLDGELATRLALIPYVSTGTVVLGYPRADVPHALDAVGVILPRSSRRKILAATFISSKWIGRSPEGMAMIRVFVGGHRDPEALRKGDDDLVAIAREELGSLLGIRVRPALARVFRFERGNAQPLVGHGERLRRLRGIVERHPGLHLAGAAFEGVGIPDCVRQATETASRISKSAGR